jgi:ATPase involved in DNA replication initiation
MNLIWNNCLTKLENEIASSDFSTWIRPLQAIETDGQIKLLAPNKFVLDWVKQHYFAKIEETVHEFSDGKFNLTFEIGSKKTISQPTSSPLKPTEAKK